MKWKRKLQITRQLDSYGNFSKGLMFAAVTVQVATAFYSKTLQVCAVAAFLRSSDPGFVGLNLSMGFCVRRLLKGALLLRTSV